MIVPEINEGHQSVMYKKVVLMYIPGHLQFEAHAIMNFVITQCDMVLERDGNKKFNNGISSSKDSTEIP